MLSIGVDVRRIIDNRYPKRIINNETSCCRCRPFSVSRYCRHVAARIRRATHARLFNSFTGCYRIGEPIRPQITRYSGVRVLSVYPRTEAYCFRFHDDVTKIPRERPNLYGRVLINCRSNNNFVREARRRSNLNSGRL